MSTATFLTRPALWIALFAILWASLAPSMAHGDSHAGHSMRVNMDYCTGASASSTSIEMPQDRAHDEQTPSHEDSHHCPLCRNPQANVGILPTPVIVLPAAAGRMTYPALFYRASHPLYAWSAAQPRAPPAA